ncbi:MAG: hypothetical protein R3195_13205 [Gemmatimonadota bacterium]|nr:hypothetical protein [Gemmatimonadota bacterium]
MSRKIVAVEAVGDGKRLYVFCDDGTVWSWTRPTYRKASEQAWSFVDPPLPQETPAPAAGSFGD